MITLALSCLQLKVSGMPSDNAVSDRVIERQIDIPQHPELAVFPTKHGCGCVDTDHTQNHAPSLRCLYGFDTYIISVVGLTQLVHYLVTCEVISLTPGELHGHIAGTTWHSQGIVSTVLSQPLLLLNRMPRIRRKP